MSKNCDARLRIRLCAEVAKKRRLRSLTRTSSGRLALTFAASSIQTTISQASPDGFTRFVSNRKAQPLVVALRALCHVGEDEGPVVAERLEHVAQRAQVAPDLLDRDDVAATDEARDISDVGQVALRRGVGRRRPVLGQVGERAQVPGADDGVRAWRLGWNNLVNGRVEPRDLGRDRRRRSGDVELRRQTALLSGATLTW